MNPLAGLFLVARHAFGRALYGKRALALAVLAILPVGMALLMVRFADNLDLDNFMVTILMVSLQFVVPFCGLFLGVAVLGDEIEGRTITYLYTRPLGRSVFFLGRLIGSAVACWLMLAVSLLATTQVFASRIDLSATEILGTVGIALLGSMVYMALFAALRLYVERALFVGFLIGFVVEGAISKMPVSGVSRCSIWHHLALLQTRLFEGRPFYVDEVLEGLAPEETVAGSLTVLVVLLVASVVVGAYAVKTREIRVPAAVA